MECRSNSVGHVVKLILGIDLAATISIGIVDMAFAISFLR